MHEDWVQWSTIMRAYSGALDPSLLEEMNTAAASLTPIDNSTMAEPQRQRSCSLYYILVMLLEGSAHAKAANCSVGHGIELWRRPVLEYEPRAGSRTAGLLV